MYINIVNWYNIIYHNNKIKYTEFIMERVLYHGSEFIIKEPKHLIGNVHNDYGLGFYCTTNKELAKEWAAKRSGTGYINKYRLRDDRLKILDLTKPPYNDVLYWVSLLMHNRVLSNILRNNYPRELKYLDEKYLLDVNEYDVVIGFRADDSYFHFPEAFVRSEITLESLNLIFKAGELGKQYVLISERAFNLIKFIDYEEVTEKSKEDYYKRKDEADKIFTELLESDRYKKGIRMRDLVMDDE